MAMGPDDIKTSRYRRLNSILEFFMGLSCEGSAVLPG
jgi:hypothetical protein